VAVLTLVVAVDEVVSSFWVYSRPKTSGNHINGTKIYSGCLNSSICKETNEFKNSFLNLIFINILKQKLSLIDIH
jgi:hypothetical protein